MNPAERVGFLNADNHFGDIPLSDCFGKDVVSNEKSQEITSGHILHDKVQVIKILEARNERYNPAYISQYSQVCTEKFQIPSRNMALRLTNESLLRQPESLALPEDALLDCYVAYRTSE